METLLLWEGSLDNARVREVFGLQTVQASRMVAAFIAEHKHDVLRATAHAPVVGAEGFKPIYASTEPDEYLRLVAQLRPAEVAPFIEDARIDLAPASAQIYSTLNRACRLQLGVKLRYRSLKNPEGVERIVFPHSLVRAARRWHVRAWCATRQEYRDFALGRIQSSVLTEEHMEDGGAGDLAWHEFTDMVIAPHPALSASQTSLLRDEYLGGRATAHVQVRRALISYVAQDLRLAINPEKDIPPAYQLLLVNASQFPEAFFTAAPPDRVD